LSSSERTRTSSMTTPSSSIALVSTAKIAAVASSESVTRMSVANLPAAPAASKPVTTLTTMRPTQTPADMLAKANRLRGQREWGQAADLYQRVMTSKTDEAYAATVALAALHLEHLSDPRGALALYERALAMMPNGPLSAQAERGVER